MFRKILLGSVIVASPSLASAAVVYSNSLQNLNGPYGGGSATTTTDASGKSTTVTGPSGGANRASGVAGFDSWFQANVGGGGTVGITSQYAFDGNGSVSFMTTSDGSKADLQYYIQSPALLSSLTSLSYDFYRDAESTVGAKLAPVLRLDIAKTTGNSTVAAGSLVFENVYQQQADTPTNAWTMLSATLNQGIFWATNAALGPTFASANGGQKTLQAWIDGNSGSTLSVYGMSIGVGSGWGDAKFSGAIDDVSAAFGARTFASNFEVSPAATAVPEPASLALTVAGIGALALVRRRRAG